MSLGLKILLGLGILAVGLFVVSKLMTTVAADEIVVKQDLLDGTLRVWDTPGVHFQNFGSIKRYKKSSQYWFSAKEDEGKKTDDAIRVRYNDGAHSNISGSLRFNLPSDHQKMIKLHSTYGSMEAIEHELIKQVVNKSVYMTGPLMSSRESYAERRADLINFISDQVLNGVYRTQRKQVKVIDPISGQEKTTDFMEPKLGPGPNGIEREEESPIQQFGLTVYNITINGIEYDNQVEDQIKQQQQAIMAVQQAMVNAKKAEQDAITTEQQGKAEAAKAKWAQEVEKATAVTAAEKEKAVAITQAQKEKEVAALALETAKLEAQKTTTSAKADADAKRLAMQANNQLELRLDVYKEVAIEQAKAIGAQRQVPDIQMGGGYSGGVNSTQQLMEVLAAKTARDLNVSPKP